MAQHAIKGWAEFNLVLILNYISIKNDKKKIELDFGDIFRIYPFIHDMINETIRLFSLSTQVSYATNIKFSHLQKSRKIRKS